jgi:hypothetical protein
MIGRKILASTVSATVLLFTAGMVQAQDFAISKEEINVGKKQYSPYLHQSYPNRVFWGDTHLHTSYSTDAGMVGNTLGPEEVSLSETQVRIYFVKAAMRMPCE